MNKVILIGRLTKDPDIRYTQGQNSMCIARYSLAVDRRGKEKGADFINCVAFGKGGEFAEKYLKKGTKIAITGRLQTGSYKNRDGQTVYTTDVVIEEQEFCESKGGSQQNAPATAQPTAPEPQQSEIDGFMSIPEGIDEELPFT